MNLDRIIEALGVTAEILGHVLSPAALFQMARKLEPYGEQAALEAIDAVQTQCRRLTLADVIERIQIMDGRPRSDEAWANALAAMDEADTVVWTEEAAQAFAVARPLLELNDKTGARMAFRDAYERLCQKARESRVPVRWKESLGWDSERRRVVLESAVQAGRITNERAAGLLPPPEPSAERKDAVLALVATNGVLTNEASSAIERENARKRIAAIKAMLAGPKEGAA